MRDHTLQFVAVEQFEGALRNGDGGITRLVAGRKSIDAVFLLQNVDFRYRHAGCDRHFLDDIA